MPHFSRWQFCVVLTAVYICLTAGCVQRIDTAREFVELAYQHERDSRIPEAVVAYRKALELDPKSASTWYDLGVAFAAMEQFPDAIDAYSKAIDLDGGMDRAFNNRAAAYAALKQLKNAVADCDSAIALQPRDYLAWRNRGLAQHDLGNRKDAIKDYDESIRLNGQIAATYLYRGNAYLEDKSWERSLEDFNHAVHLDESLAAAWHSRAKALVQLNRSEEALEAASKARELGAEVDDILQANLAGKIADLGGLANTDSVMSFAAQWLKEQGITVHDAAAPWDFRQLDPTGQRRFVVRTVSSTAGRVDIRFTDEELRQMESESDVNVTLVVLEELSTTGENPHGVAYRVLQSIDNWRPDFQAMQPMTWALKISEQSPTTED